jgi:hypothetical protein
VDVAAKGFEPEINRLHVLVTAGVRTLRILINDMRRHAPCLASGSIDIVHRREIGGGRVRRCDRVRQRSRYSQSSSVGRMRRAMPTSGEAELRGSVPKQSFGNEENGSHNVMIR